MAILQGWRRFVGASCQTRRGHSEDLGGAVRLGDAAVISTNAGLGKALPGLQLQRCLARSSSHSLRTVVDPGAAATKKAQPGAMATVRGAVRTYTGPAPAARDGSFLKAALAPCLRCQEGCRPCAQAGTRYERRVSTQSQVPARQRAASTYLGCTARKHADLNRHPAAAWKSHRHHHHGSLGRQGEAAARCAFIQLANFRYRYSMLQAPCSKLHAPSAPSAPCSVLRLAGRDAKPVCNNGAAQRPLATRRKRATHGGSSYSKAPTPLAISNGRRWGCDGPVQRTGAWRGVCPVSATSQAALLGDTTPTTHEGPRGLGLWLGGRGLRAQHSGRMVCGKRVNGSCQREHQPLTPVNPHPARRVPAAAGRALGRHRLDAAKAYMMHTCTYLHAYSSAAPARPASAQGAAASATACECPLPSRAHKTFEWRRGSAPISDAM
ncbi:hypothetical protein TARUN_8147 [Trichoderma arundinaceum]|uniref:Uncharacterized protein n=1 Tax=Trichoderma arundinaceum TaxID=490622 RepID=A0A395NDC8_TRIAR|nr:hypothetical protein TARUN_8147 [Trichoderma arundinaceum]